MIVYQDSQCPVVSPPFVVGSGFFAQNIALTLSRDAVEGKALNVVDHEDTITTDGQLQRSQ